MLALMNIIYAMVIVASASASSFRTLQQPAVNSHQAPNITLGECINYAIMAGSKVAFNGQTSTVYTGNVGIAPGTDVSGSFVVEDGSIEVNTVSAKTCRSDFYTAYAQAKAANCNNNTINNLSGLTISPGVYCTAGTDLEFTAGTVTLDGLGNVNAVFIFQTAKALITSAYTSFILKNGAQAKNIFFQVGSSATLSESSAFIGNILAYASVTSDTNVATTGRMLAGAAVTFAGQDRITMPSN